jgi:hypothetical protein
MPVGAAAPALISEVEVVSGQQVPEALDEATVLDHRCHVSLFTRGNCVRGGLVQCHIAPLRRVYWYDAVARGNVT